MKRAVVSSENTMWRAAAEGSFGTAANCCTRRCTVVGKHSQQQNLYLPFRDAQLQGLTLVNPGRDNAGIICSGACQSALRTFYRNHLPNYFAFGVKIHPTFPSCLPSPCTFWNSGCGKTRDLTAGRQAQALSACFQGMHTITRSSDILRPPDFSEAHAKSPHTTNPSTHIGNLWLQIYSLVANCKQPFTQVSKGAAGCTLRHLVNPVD